MAATGCEPDAVRARQNANVHRRLVYDLDRTGRSSAAGSLRRSSPATHLRRPPMRIALRSTTLLSTLLAATVAHATTFVVPPGPGTPVQDAIDAAADGD